MTLGPSPVIARTAATGIKEYQHRRRCKGDPSRLLEQRIYQECTRWDRRRHLDYRNECS